jgi:carbon-monoxide dehydrogenase medium subunit
MSFGSSYVTLPDFEYHKPKTIEEVLTLLDKYGDEAKLMAGGVGLLAFMKERLMSPSHLIDIKAVDELKRIKNTPGKGLSVGAAVSLSEVEMSEVVQEKFPLLHQAIIRVADPMIRGRATLVGNICEAIPWVDTPPVLMALDASVVVVGRSGERRIPIGSFIRGPVDIDLESGEFVSQVEIPEMIPESRSAFEKFTGGSEFSLASVSVCVSSIAGKRSAKIVYGAVNSMPARCREAEREIEQEATWVGIRKAAKVASDNVECMSDVLASSDYRKHLVEVITLTALGRLFGK